MSEQDDLVEAAIAYLAATDARITLAVKRLRNEKAFRAAFDAGEEEETARRRFADALIAVAPQRKTEIRRYVCGLDQPKF